MAPLLGESSAEPSSVPALPYAARERAYFEAAHVLHAEHLSLASLHSDQAAILESVATAPGVPPVQLTVDGGVSSPPPSVDGVVVQCETIVGDGLSLSNDDSRPMVVGALVSGDNAASPFLEAAGCASGSVASIGSAPFTLSGAKRSDSCATQRCADLNTVLSAQSSLVVLLAQSGLVLSAQGSLLFCCIGSSRQLAVLSAQGSLLSCCVVSSRQLSVLSAQGSLVLSAQGSLLCCQLKAACVSSRQLAVLLYWQLQGSLLCCQLKAALYCQLKAACCVVSSRQPCFVSSRQLVVLSAQGSFCQLKAACCFVVLAAQGQLVVLSAQGSFVLSAQGSLLLCHPKWLVSLSAQGSLVIASSKQPVVLSTQCPVVFRSLSSSPSQCLADTCTRRSALYCTPRALRRVRLHDRGWRPFWLHATRVLADRRHRRPRWRLRSLH